MSCVLVCDIVRFDLRVFLGVLAAFCVLCGKLLGCARENGLEWLKMCCYCSGIRIIMLLRYNKKGFCGSYARAQVCACVYVYLINEYTNLICLLILKRVLF